jgi:hypothetical protein
MGKHDEHNEENCEVISKRFWLDWLGILILAWSSLMIIIGITLVTLAGI